jgi:hypothetical protein
MPHSTVMVEKPDIIRPVPGQRRRTVGCFTFFLCSTEGSGFQVPFYLKRKGPTETSGALSVICFTLNSISYSALVYKRHRHWAKQKRQSS